MNAPEVLVLSAQDVRSLLTLDDCIVAVEQAFRLHGEGKAAAPAVLSVHPPGGGFHVKAGVLNLGRRYFAAKVNGNFPDNDSRFGLPTIQGVIVLCDAEKGSPLALMDSREITSLRTAAATAVAAKHLARAGSRTLTVCGCGTQGRVQARALALVFPIERIFTYDQNAVRAGQLAQELSEELTISVTPVDDLSAATRQSDLCVTCTTSHHPLLGPDDIRSGTFIAAVGADNPEKNEIHPLLMANSKVVVDILDQCAEMGDLHHALHARVITREDVRAELGEIVAGKKVGRHSEEEIIIFDSTGTALQDVAAAAFLYEKSQGQGAGVRLNLAV
jgi:alanine dehydrogenase